MTPKTSKEIVRAFALLCVCAGGFGMVVVVPYLVLNNWIIVAAAGLSFIAGAVLVAGGLLSITHLINN